MGEATLPDVSVIIPVFNGESHIQNAIDSVIGQTFKNWELIIIDDGSMDNTSDILKNNQQQDSRINIFFRKSGNKGAPACRNFGINISKAQFIVFLDADDILLPHCLDQRVRRMNENPDLNFAIFRQNISSDAHLYKSIVFNLPLTDRQSLIKSFISFKYPWQTSAPIWRLDFLKSLGGFDESYYRMEDPDLHLRALISTNNFFCFYEDPIDSVYFNNEKSHTDVDRFYLNISSDILRFIQKSWENLQSLSDIFHTVLPIKKAIEEGFFHMLKYYLLARFNVTYSNYLKIIYFLRINSILKLKSTLKLKLISMIFASNLLIVKKLRLRGLVYRLVFI